MDAAKYGWVLFGCLALGGVACATPDETDDDVSGSNDELGTQNKSYVSVRHDTRRCMAPLCGGYYVRDVNRQTAERYVSGLDFGPAGFDPATEEAVRNSLGGELLLRGKLGPADPQFGVRSFLVSEIYRGMPGITPIAGDVHYKTALRNPQIQCFAAPCNNEVATKLNFTAKTYFTGYSVELASYPNVDQSWLVNQLENHGGAAAALFVNGQQFPAGKEKILDASQVYIRLPVSEGPCPMKPEPVCTGGTVPTYTRNADRCVVFDACVTPGVCAQSLPVCETDYTLESWAAGPHACPAYACDPSFAVD